MTDRRNWTSPKPHGEPSEASDPAGLDPNTVPLSPPGDKPTPGSTATGERKGQAAALYSLLVNDALIEERKSKSAIEQRGAGVITTSGALVSLLLGLAALASHSKSATIPDSARVFMGVAVALFVAAALAAIATFIPRRYFEVDPTQLESLLKDENLDKGPEAASRTILNLNAAIFAVARRVNERKVAWLRAALTFEVLAVAAVASAVAIALTN